MTALRRLGTTEDTVYRRVDRRYLVLLAIGLMALAGCASLPPGSDFAKTSSSALARPEQTRMGRQLAAAKAEHPGTSGFKLLPVGIDSFLLRMEMAQAAERTLDVQYFLIQSDDTGQLLIEALLKAADRGVRVRVLLDDAGSFGRDAQIRTLAGYPNIELRLFNPFAYRGNVDFVHAAEFLADATRLNYRMHNKLFVVDNEIGIVGGRNIGDEYFQGGRDYRIRRLRHHRRRPDRQRGLEELRRILEQPDGDSDRSARRQASPPRKTSTTIAAFSPRITRKMIDANAALHAHAGRRRAARRQCSTASHRSSGRRRKSSTTARKKRRSRTASKAAGCCGIGSARWRNRSRRS